jgi:hypothetical protein
MVVWRGLSGAMVHVGEDAEAKLRVFIEDLALRHIVAEVGGDEVIVLQHVLQQRADLLPAGGSWVGLQGIVTGGGELLERVGHDHASSAMSVLIPLTPPSPEGRGRAYRQRHMYHTYPHNRCRGSSCGL